MSSQYTVLDIEVVAVQNLTTGENTLGLSFMIMDDAGATVSYLLPHEAKAFVVRAVAKLAELEERLDSETGTG